MSRRLLLAGWLTLVLAVTVPWTGYRDHAHWDRVAWTPFAAAYKPLDVVGNIVLYLPLGWFWPAADRHGRPPRSAVAAPMVLALLVSIATEWTQVYSHGRFPSSLDVACNTLGA